MASEFENTRQAQSKSRLERRQARVAALTERIKEESQEKGLEQKRPKKRLIPIWLRLLIVAFLLVISLITGLMVGYGVIGDGAAMDALKSSTWQHLIDLVEKGTSSTKS